MPDAPAQPRNRAASEWLSVSPAPQTLVAGNSFGVTIRATVTGRGLPCPVPQADALPGKGLENA
ncbi:hypothetical protein Acy02nite_35680 [Actinoplanes cyaneus]|uniref:Uncharacterized protein n=1 Tax=Actinoplanes cyaneus TaxID=52696 RepID=A0A919IJU1_9ACTN|nr:hypothetical protein Acy02nite_35680 [Actinoplanes cyaneus]